MANPGIDIEAYYTRYGAMVHRRCLSLLGDEAMARDALHEVFVRLMERKGRLRDQYPSSLLFRMATNVCLNMIRSDKRLNGFDNAALLDIASTENVEKSLFVRSALEKLFSGEKESSRAIAVMHYIDKMTLAEIASETNMSVSGVRKRLRKLRDKSKTLQEDGDV